MFALTSTAPTLTAVPRASARVGGGRRATSTVVAAAAGPTTSSKIAMGVERVKRVAASGVLAVALVLSPLAVAPAAFAEGCAASCEQECLKVAPGSGEYCASACSDECSALKEDNGGEEVESGAFGQQQEKGDFQDLLEKMLDAQKIFFVGPSTQMRKQ